jgi:hypothetical protein
MVVTAPPARIEIGTIRFSGLARPAALRAAASFEHALASLAEGRAECAPARPGGPLTVRWNADPERLGRSVAEAVYARIKG